MTHPTKAPPQRSAAAKPLSLLRAVGLAYSAPEPIVTPKVLLRLPDMGDFEAWAALREQSRRFLAPWEPAWPLDDLTRPPSAAASPAIARTGATTRATPSSSTAPRTGLSSAGSPSPMSGAASPRWSRSATGWARPMPARAI